MSSQRTHSRFVQGRLLAASALVHAILLLGVGRWDHPNHVPASKPTEQRPEVLLFDLPPLRQSPKRAPARESARTGAPPRSDPPIGRGSSRNLPETERERPIENREETSSGDGTQTPPTPGTGAYPLRARARDPRLYVRADGIRLPGEHPNAERLVTDAQAAIRAEPERVADAKRRSLAHRQVTILGRRITVFGDSASAGVRDETIEQRRDIQTLPVDGALWERLQLSRQRDAFVRDAILKERARATRRRKDAERNARRR